MVAHQGVVGDSHGSLGETQGPLSSGNRNDYREDLVSLDTGPQLWGKRILHVEQS